VLFATANFSDVSGLINPPMPETMVRVSRITHCRLATVLIYRRSAIIRDFVAQGYGDESLNKVRGFSVSMPLCLSGQPAFLRKRHHRLSLRQGIPTHLNTDARLYLLSRPAMTWIDGKSRTLNARVLNKYCQAIQRLPRDPGFPCQYPHVGCVSIRDSAVSSNSLSDMAHVLLFRLPNRVWPIHVSRSRSGTLKKPRYRQSFLVSWW
jgi:hypothetical protein